MQVNRTLEEINMGKHAVRDHGARIIAQSLLDNTTLTSVNLRCNEIGISGGEALAALLIKGCSVVDLNLASNRIADDGAFAFGAALKAEKAQESLMRLDLSKNGICDDGLVAIAAGMETNSNLSRLALWGNKFDQPSSRKFDDLFASRFQYTGLEADFSTYVVDGEVFIAAVG